LIVPFVNGTMYDWHLEMGNEVHCMEAGLDLLEMPEGMTSRRGLSTTGNRVSIRTGAQEGRGRKRGGSEVSCGRKGNAVKIR